MLRRVDWAERAQRAVERYEGGETRDLDQRQLTQLGNAAWAAGLSFLMAGRRDEAADWLRRAAERYRESWQDAPPDSWGRPIAAMKALLLAGDDASDAAQWALDVGAAQAESPIGRYAGALALLVLGRDLDARTLASTLRDRDDFPRDVADAVTTIAAGDRAGYLIAVEDVLDSFEKREEFLEDVPVADTVLVLQLLAAKRDVAVELPASERLP
jgi:tetratricopeptide (TPR) repeat protein